VISILNSQLSIIKTVRLFFRRANPTGNVSIENSFATMQTAFPTDKGFALSAFVSTFYSRGILPRLKAVLEVGRNQADINHVTGDTNFLALGLPRRNTILTIHDCGLLDGKNWLARWILKIFWLQLPVWHSRLVTVVSEATKRDVMRLTGCRAEKIVVIPTVILPRFQFKSKQFNKAYPVFLHIGNSPNKNLERHAAALAGLPCRLRVIGKISDKQIAHLKNLGLDFTVEYNLTDAELQNSYASADALLFCSTLEGFGMPILEAQAVGRVVITSNVSSMPEVAGGGAVLVDPLSIADIRAAIDRIIQDNDYRNTLINTGLENVKRFDPSVVAAQYAAVYKRVLALQENAHSLDVTLHPAELYAAKRES
jgi:glycosyltransferase involved in cell wall biosynthesis